MKTIEESLQKLHAQARAEKENSPVRHCEHPYIHLLSSPLKLDTQKPPPAAAAAPPLTPFARINSVADGSPANKV